MANSNSISQRLRETLGQLIMAAPPNQKLPSEPELARRLGVSRATLREAMRSFETQGLIRRRQGSGTYVIHPSGVIESGLEALESIETLAQRIHLPVKMDALTVASRPANEDEARALGISGEAVVTCISRAILAEDHPVAYLVDILPQAIVTEADLRGQFNGSVLDMLRQRGTPILSYSRTEINAVTATPDIAKAMGIQKGDVLLRFIGYLYTTEHRVVDYSFSYFLPGYFHFHVIRQVGSS